MPRGDRNRRSFTYTNLSPSLAYLVGVCLGDGYVYGWENRYFNFVHKSIDIDFLAKTQDAIYQVLGYRPLIKFARKAKNDKSNDQYVIHACSSQFGKWLIDYTQKKEMIPLEILSNQNQETVAFLQALMDFGRVYFYKESR